MFSRFEYVKGVTTLATSDMPLCALTHPTAVHLLSNCQPIWKVKHMYHIYDGS
jgi:hypothetical protein